MSAMPAVELPEESAGLLDEPADLLAIVAAVQPMRTAVQSEGSAVQSEGSALRSVNGTVPPSPSAARRAAARWAKAVPAAHPAQSPSRAASAPLRLTRRGRIVIGAAAVILLAGLSLIVAVSAQATSQAPAGQGRGVTQLTVRPGQSLWSVAESADPSADTRAVVQQIVELNSLTGSAVFAGQQLWVPRA